MRFQGSAALQPGSVLALSRVGDRFNGNVYVTGVRHEFSNNDWLTDAEFGLARALHAARPEVSHLPAAGLAAAVHGLQVGVVTAIADDPGNEHRVRVRVPLAGMAEDGVWARVATLDAGSKRGTFFRPEKDDEVVLGFFHGDPAQPVILGMLHSSGHEPPVQADADNDAKVYVSRAGIALRFDDKKKSVTLETPGGNKVVLSDDDKGLLLEDQNGNSIRLDKDGITLQSAKAVAFQGQDGLHGRGEQGGVQGADRLHGQGPVPGRGLQQRQPDPQGRHGDDQLSRRPASCPPPPESPTCTCAPWSPASSRTWADRRCPRVASRC